MKMYFRTNLDLCHCERWPDELPEVPHVGDLIQSAHEWEYLPKGFNDGTRTQEEINKCKRLKARIELRVCQVTWIAKEERNDLYRPPTWGLWEPEIELHLPQSRFENLTAFYEFYGVITGRGKHAFI